MNKIVLASLLLLLGCNQLPTNKPPPLPTRFELLSKDDIDNAFDLFVLKDKITGEELICSYHGSCFPSGRMLDNKNVEIKQFDYTN